MQNTAFQIDAITTPDGARLAIHHAGEGPTVFLLHGFLSRAALNWIAPGIATAIVAAGFHVIAPDMRGHGESLAPLPPPPYAHDCLAADIEQVAKAFSVRDYALVGYSLGARTAARMLARGAAPRRLILAGMGASGVLATASRQAYFEDAIRHGERAANPRAGVFIQSFMRANGVTAEPALAVLASQMDTPPAALAGVRCPTLVLCGDRDEDNGSSADLAALIPGAQLIRTPGDHFSAVGKIEFRTALVDFLKRDLAPSRAHTGASAD
jgi:pimeloyl-ACP methyl ester carboxylesterase